MEMTDQLWLLKQIYSGENCHYDSETKGFEYRIPAAVSAEQQKALEQAGRMPNRLLCLGHDETIEELCRLADEWTLTEAADAFVAGLWSAPFLWQCALPAKVMAAVMPVHAHMPYGGSADTCKVCGFRNGPVDATLSWYRRMTGSAPLDGDPAGYVLALREMRNAGTRPVPTEYDRWTFRAVLTTIRQAPPKTRYSKMRELLYRQKLLPAAAPWVYSSLLEVLALMGILDTEEHPGMAVRYTTYAERDRRPSVRAEVQAPLAWWDSSVGINDTVLNRLFSWLDTLPVAGEHRPEPVPPAAQTVTGSLKGKRMPRPGAPKSPDAGHGPARAGDVYAVRIREGVWVTMYCYAIEERYAIVEYLDGVFSEMPMKPQLCGKVRPRSGGRWKTKVSGIDQTSGVRRVARDMPLPETELPEPDRVPFSRAADLKSLAHWCFQELD